MFSSTGQALATGFTPVTFTTVAGVTYGLQADGYGNCVFSSWSDGVTSNPRTITATTGTLTFTSIYNCGVTAPSSPTGLTATTVSSDQINLAWTAPSNNGGSSITGYMIQRSTNGGSTWTTIVSNTGSTSTSYSDIGLSASTTYTYRVSAINAVGASPPSNTASATTQASSGTSTLSVDSVISGGGAVNGFYTVLSQGGNTVATGFTPAQFTVNNGQAYQIEVEGYGSYYFQFWQSAGSVNSPDTVSVTSSTTLTAVMCNGPPGDCPQPTPQNGITVYAHRIPASYWAPCFASACANPLASCTNNCTGPGAAMYFVLEDSSGNVLQTALANEGGYTFTGLTAGATYYVYADNCNLCHGSTHDVLFNYWGSTSGTSTSTSDPIAATVGTNLNSWYSCTNGCA
ncbi:MAG: fibronectin type III domain-containing protein [Nitrososphaerota archaeon]|nr:fibronectin type III domain-containing protein [Nitrososphaerota archaeon]